MLQNYAFIHKNNVFSKIFALNFLKSNNLKVLMAFFRIFAPSTKTLRL